MELELRAVGGSRVQKAPQGSSWAMSVRESVAVQSPKTYDQQVARLCIQASSSKERRRLEASTGAIQAQSIQKPQVANPRTPSDPLRIRCLRPPPGLTPPNQGSRRHHIIDSDSHISHFIRQVIEGKERKPQTQKIVPNDPSVGRVLRGLP